MPSDTADVYRPTEPVGGDYNPLGEDLTPQEAIDHIGALCRVARRECYLPENPPRNHRNAGRVRALAQALKLLERAGLEPDDEAVDKLSEEVRADAE